MRVKAANKQQPRENVRTDGGKTYDEHTMAADIGRVCNFWVRAAEGVVQTQREDAREYRRRIALQKSAPPVPCFRPHQSPRRDTQPPPLERSLRFNDDTPGLGDRIFPAKVGDVQREVLDSCHTLLARYGSGCACTAPCAGSAKLAFC